MATALRFPTPPPPRDRRTGSRRPSYLRPVSLPPQPSSRSAQSLRHPASNSRSVIAAHRVHNVQQLPAQTPLPQWLRLLIRVQKGSAIVALILGAAALVVYSSAIFIQQQWSKDYEKLKSMQRSERQMVAAGEFLKNQLIQQAEQPGSGLVPKTSSHMIYLEPAPERPPVETPAEPLQRDPETTNTNEDPLGY